MAPALRASYGLSLSQAGVLISGPLAGSVVSLVPWGLAADRVGERLVLGVGLTLCGTALLFAAHVSSFGSLAALLALAGMAGASVQSASGRAVMQWFGVAERGLALGIRQTAIPLGGLLTSLTLPHIVSARGVSGGFSALGVFCIVAGTVGAILIRDSPTKAANEARDAHGAASPFRDRSLWLLSGGSALLAAPQICLVGFMVLFLHDRRGLSPGAAAAVLAAVQLLGVCARVAAGHWSDRMRTRLVPLRRITLALTALVAVATLLLSAPLAVLVPALIITGAVSMSWNGLAFAAAAELAGYARSGTAIGVQQTVINSSSAVLPGLFGALVAATSWRLGFGAVALLALAGWRVFGLVRA